MAVVCRTFSPIGMAISSCPTRQKCRLIAPNSRDRRIARARRRPENVWVLRRKHRRGPASPGFPAASTRCSIIKTCFVVYTTAQYTGSSVPGVGLYENDPPTTRKCGRDIPARARRNPPTHHSQSSGRQRPNLMIWMRGSLGVGEGIDGAQGIATSLHGETGTDGEAIRATSPEVPPTNRPCAVGFRLPWRHG